MNNARAKAFPPNSGAPRSGRPGIGLLLAALMVASCSSGDSSAPDTSGPDTSGPGSTTPGDSTPATSTTTKAGGGTADVYEVPAQHPSDWGAPDVALPDVPLPYGPSPEATADPAFYDVATLDAAAVGEARPGDVLRSEPVEMTGPLDGVSGWRILYRSTAADGRPEVVSGIVLVPEGPAPEEGRPVVAWAHGTTGIADRCAPSTTGNLFYDDYGAEGRRLVDQGFVVAATDYHGLGTPGVHTYHHSEELARATIDSVSAAHDLEEAGPLSPRWAVVGHSEGGLAALAVDERSQDMPPELDYRGSVVAAPTPRLEDVAPLMFVVEGRGYGVLLLEAVAEVAPELAPPVALGAEAAGREALLTHGCWEEAVPGYDDIPPDQMLASPAIGERLSEVLADWAAYDPTGAVGPLLVAQGESDESVPPPLTTQLVDELCELGVPVEYHTYEGVSHDPVMEASADDAATWLAARMAGDPPATSCS